MIAEARLIARRIRALERLEYSKSERLVYVVCERFLHPDRVVTFHLSFLSFPNNGGSDSPLKGVIVGPYRIPDTIDASVSLADQADLLYDYGIAPSKVLKVERFLFFD